MIKILAKSYFSVLLFLTKKKNNKILVLSLPLGTGTLQSQRQNKTNKCLLDEVVLKE